MNDNAQSRLLLKDVDGKFQDSQQGAKRQSSLSKNTLSANWRYKFPSFRGKKPIDEYF